jgi:hypothetical protein
MAHRGANDEKGHFMTDSSSWVAGKKNVPNLEVLFKGDKFLVNTYHALDQPESTAPGALWAAKFTDFIASDEWQRSKGAITADVSATVSEIAAIMTEKNIHRLPITKEGELVGIAARPDILKSQMNPSYCPWHKESQSPPGYTYQAASEIWNNKDDRKGCSHG